MSKKLYLIFENLNLLSKTIRQDVSIHEKDLPNKYLYVGNYGAMLWNKIENNYKPGIVGGELLTNYFPDIHTHIASTSGGVFDIVSLGTGSGEDDIKILNIISQFAEPSNKKDIRYTAVDLSMNLLVQGVDRIDSFVQKHSRLRSLICQITGICVDIEKLSVVSEVKAINRSGRTTLFHLLGLTIGNNQETLFIKSIYNAMRGNDYLLLGVDFSADDEKILQSTESFYRDGNIGEDINRFLCSPLYFLTEIEKKESTSYYRDENNRSYYKESKLSKLTNITIQHEKVEANSDIQGTISFQRKLHYQRKGERFVRVCDYSNKYKRQSFEDFLLKELPKRGVHFQLIKYYGSAESPQYLILLKKESRGKAKSRRCGNEKSRGEGHPSLSKEIFPHKK